MTSVRSSAAIERASRLGREVATFGVVGLIGFVTDVGLFNLLRFGPGGLLADKPLTAKTISVLVATMLTYLGNRHWTWRDRPRGSRHAEASLFILFNAIGMAISLGCLALSHYALDLRSPLADNLSANGIGLVLGTTFRFWSYRTYVFKDRVVADRDQPV